MHVNAALVLYQGVVFGSLVLGAFLNDHAAEVGRLGGADVELVAARDLVEPAQRFLVFLGAELLQEGAAADRHQKEDLPGGDAQVAPQVGQARQLRQGLLGDGRVYLGWQADGAGVLESIHRQVEGARNAAELVVRLGAGAVEADGHGVHVELLEAVYYLVRQQGCDSGCDTNFNTELPRLFQDLPNIVALERVAAGGEEDRLGRVGGHFFQEAKGLFGRYLAGERVGLGAGAAVLAGQVAGMGHLPGDQ